MARRPAKPARTLTLSGGRRVPYPVPTSSAASNVGRGNRRVDTKCEQLLRSELHRLGGRFRKDYPIRAGSVRVRPDVVFVRRHIAVFVDGCYWHSCPEHGTTPKSNTQYWLPKLAANRERDERVGEALRSEGWTVIRVWEHEDPARAAQQIIEELRRKPPDR